MDLYLIIATLPVTTARKHNLVFIDLQGNGFTIKNARPMDRYYSINTVVNLAAAIRSANPKDTSVRTPFKTLGK